MSLLSVRQVSILKAVIDEYIDTAAPVGSEQLERKYNLGVSPATIRNEMAVLIHEGFLKQPHTSAGRVPTARALRFYINELMQESQLSVAEEVATRERIWDQRHNMYQMMQTASRTLARKLETVSIVSLASGPMYSSGYSYLLTMPEFFDIDVTRQVLSISDSLPSWMVRVIEQNMSSQEIQVVFGEELNEPYLEPVGMLFSQFQINGQSAGIIGVIGPARMNFSQSIPWLRYYSHLFEDLGRDW